MADRDADLRAILIPLADAKLLLPVALVAEVTGLAEPTPLPSAPPWLTGALSWRRRFIPLLAFERVMGRSVPVDSGLRAVVLRFLDGAPDLAFYALHAVATPRVLRVSEAVMHDLGRRSDLPPFVAARVSLGDGGAAVIPDLDLLQQSLRKVWSRVRDPRIVKSGMAVPSDGAGKKR